MIQTRYVAIHKLKTHKKITMLKLKALPLSSINVYMSTFEHGQNLPALITCRRVPPMIYSMRMYKLVDVSYLACFVE